MSEPLTNDALEGFVGALRGESSAEIQRLLAGFADRRLKAGLRVAGVIEIAEPVAKGACRSLALREIGTGSLFPIAQDLGPGSQACNLDTSGLAAACASVLRAIDRGADVVILSKFGKLESNGSGLLDCFGAAAEAGVPCVTGVAPPLSAPLTEFAGEYLQWIDASENALENWWVAHKRAPSAA